MKKIQVFGIPNCSSVKKARLWLQENQIDHEFHDFKKEGLSAADLDTWLLRVDWLVLINRKGTTWRGLTELEQNSIKDRVSARSAMLARPNLVKRPVLVAGQKVVVGVNPEAWSAVIGSKQNIKEST